MTDRELDQQLLEALERAQMELHGTTPTQDIQEAITALRDRLARQEPASIRERWNVELDGNDLLVCFNDHEKGDACRYERYVPVARLYTAPPPAREWQELTDEETYEATSDASVNLLELAKLWADNEIHVYQFDNEAQKIVKASARAIEAKLKEKNA